MPRVFVLSGQDVGHSVPFEGEVDLGRAKNLAVSLRSASVSRRHARLFFDAGHWWLEDLGSVNGTFVGARRIDPDSPVALDDGTVFRLGDLELRFRVELEARDRGGSSTTVLEGDESKTDSSGGASDGLELEGVEEIELEGTWEATPAPDPGPVAPTVRARGRTAERAPHAGRSTGGERRTAAGGRVLQYRKVEPRGGFFGADLSQYPFWVRALVGLLLLALFVGLTYGAFHLTATLRGRGSAPVELLSSD